MSDFILAVDLIRVPALHCLQCLFRGGKLQRRAEELLSESGAKASLPCCSAIFFAEAPARRAFYLLAGN